MKKQYFLLLIVAIILVTAVFLRLSSKEDDWICQDGSWVKHGQPSEPMPTTSCPGGLIASVAIPVSTATPSTISESTTSPEIIITSPAADSLINSPLTVSGQAKGNWFFEASLPVRLIDSDNQIIVAHYGTAQSDWMTEELVPFQATLNFTTTATSGYLVVSKDNPSGLPQNEGSFRIPVKFKQ